ncbi:hypothetical protein ACQ9ZF_04945 [Cetobacterium somerae]|uniref:hypothetical protein n=1 Tax=Cetobacterium somerae TaxID=188913 RepID=UPI003D767694
MMLLDKYKTMLENENLNTAARAVIMEIVKDLEEVQAENEAEDQYFEDFSNSL